MTLMGHTTKLYQFQGIEEAKLKELKFFFYDVMQ